MPHEPIRGRWNSLPCGEFIIESWLPFVLDLFYLQVIRNGKHGSDHDAPRSAADRGAAWRLETLVVFMAFEMGEDGELRSAFEAQQMPSEHAAIARAKLMSRSYAGVIAWKRPANPDIGEFGDVPDLE